jgi:hypothetical protein
MQSLVPSHGLENKIGSVFDRLTVANAIVFQATWWACVFGGGVLSSALYGSAGIAALFGMSAYARKLVPDAVLVVVLVVVGAAMDSVWIEANVLDYGTQTVPYWIVMLWVGVALTVNHSLKFFHQRPILGALMAGISAPLCYLGGERVGAVVVPDSLQLAWVALAWFVLFYVVFVISSRNSDR